MKTIPLEATLKLSIPGPRTARFPSGTTTSGEVFRYFPHIEVPSVFTNPDRLVVNQGGYKMAVHDAHAALLAHFYNHGPELVEALRACLGMLNNTHYADHHPQCPHPDSPCLCVDELAGFRSLLSKASTVQMP